MAHSTPRKLPLDPGVKLALDQASSCLRIAPDGSAVLTRKAVQLALTRSTRSGSWDNRLLTMFDSSNLSEEAVRAARRVIVLGDWAAHINRGLPASAAKDCLEYGRIFLSDLGYDVSGYGDSAEFDRLLRYIRYLNGLSWGRPCFFGSFVGEAMEGGGFIDLVFACLSCGSEVLVEDVEIEIPVWMGGSIVDSMSESSTESECPLCGSTYEILSTNSLVGWRIDLESHERNAYGSRFRRREVGVSPLPAEGEYVFRVTFGGASDE